MSNQTTVRDPGNAMVSSTGPQRGRTIALVLLISVGLGGFVLMRHSRGAESGEEASPSEQTAAAPSKNRGARIQRTAEATLIEYGDPEDERDRGTLRMPARRNNQKIHGALSLPALPAKADAVPPITVEYELSAKAADGQPLVKVVTRSRDRIHLSIRGDSHEWLFRRNKVDRRRISAELIDHARGLILTHHESELREAGIARGWADVFALGVDLTALSEQRAGAELRTLDGYSFRAYPRGSGSLWLSDELLLPLEVEMNTPAGPLAARARRIAAGVDESLLREPTERFPDYKVMDLVDFREEHHAEAGGHAQHVHR